MDDKNNKPKKSSMPIIAISLVLGSVAVFYFGLAATWTVVLIPLGLVLMLGAICMPFAGIITGICSLCLGKEKIGKSGMIMSVIAIIVPIIAVIVTIILFGTGVARIHFM